MAWHERHVNHADEERIAAALAKAQASTDGAIIPVLARRSARYRHTAWLAAALCLALAEAAVRGGARPLPQSMAWAALLALAAAAAGACLHRLRAVRRLLTPRADRVEAVHRAAEAAFHRLALHRHPAEAGILLYVSWEEREAVVLAGAGISGLAGEAHWRETCRLLTTAAAQGRLGAGFEAAIAHAALTLAEHHPARERGPADADAGRLRILHEVF